MSSSPPEFYVLVVKIISVCGVRITEKSSKKKSLGKKVQRRHIILYYILYRGFKII